MYKRRTSFFGIPVPGAGDKIRSDDEMVKARIIENQLLAASKGAFCVVYEDGEYTWSKADDGTFVVRCASYGGKPALMGVLNCGLAQSFSTIKWTGLGSGQTHFLYVEWTPTLYEDESSFRVFSQPFRLPQTTKNLLLATINLTDQTKPVIDSNPDGKLYIKDFASHINDNTNPHTPLLVQDELVVRKQQRVSTEDQSVQGGLIVLEDKRFDGQPTIESKGEMLIADKRSMVVLSDPDNPTFETMSPSLIGSVNEVARRPKVITAESIFNGESGMLVLIDNALEIYGASVSVMKGGVPNDGLGDVTIGYYGSDSEVTSPDSFRVYNTGGVGGRFRAVVTYR
jgi:hypothetical protein